MPSDSRTRVLTPAQPVLFVSGNHATLPGLNCTLRLTEFGAAMRASKVRVGPTLARPPRVPPFLPRPAPPCPEPLTAPARRLDTSGPLCRRPSTRRQWRRPRSPLRSEREAPR